MRIASLSPAATELLFALGKDNEIVVADQFSNFPEEAARLPRLMGHTAVETQKLRAFRPDLVITATVIQEKLAAELKGQGFPVFHQDLRRLPEVFAAWQALATLVDAEAAYRPFIAGIEERFQRLRERTKGLPRQLRVYAEEWHEPPMASGNWVPELAERAGIQLFPITPGELSRAVTLEEVTRFDPELIVISWCGAGSLADRSLVLQRPGWSGLAALQMGNVRVLDDSLLNRPGPRLIDGAERLLSLAFEQLHGA